MSGPRVVRASATWPRRDDLLPAPADIEATRDLVARHPEAKMQRAIVTRVPRLDANAGGARVWIATESLQITGSFKVRGALFALSRLASRGVRRVVTASAGNHGAGVSWIAKVLGLEAIVVVPASAPTKKKDTIASHGAKLVVHDGTYDEADARAQAMAAEERIAFLPSYDHPDIVAGNGGSLGHEILDVVRPDVVLCPIGGGGLSTGIGLVVGERGERKVWGVQSEASAAFALSLERGAAVVDLPAVHSIADGLEGGIARDAFARAAGVLAGAVVVSEAAIADAMRFAERDLGLVLEGSAAVTLVPLLASDAPAGEPPALLAPVALLAPARDVVAVLTGRNVDRAG